MNRYALSCLSFVILACVGAGVSAQRDNCTQYYTTTDCPLISETYPTFDKLPSCGEAELKGDNSIAFVFLGDYGDAHRNCEAYVARLIEAIDKQFGPLDFIVTQGDNNYPQGNCSTMQQNVEQYFGKYYPHGDTFTCVDPSTNIATEYKSQNSGDSTNNKIRFFPTLGNHDWDTYQQYGMANLPYIQYFSYLKNFSSNGGEYYTVDPVKIAKTKPHLENVVQIFALNSNYGTNSTEDQMMLHQQQMWLQEELSKSKAPHKIVFFHHPPHTTAQHDMPGAWMRWPFHQYGATMVISGHEHSYERMFRPVGNGDQTFPYIVNGFGGYYELYEINGSGCVPEKGSVVRYNKDFGAILVFATPERMHMCSYSIADNGSKVDEFDILPQ